MLSALSGTGAVAPPASVVRHEPHGAQMVPCTHQIMSERAGVSFEAAALEEVDAVSLLAAVRLVRHGAPATMQCTRTVGTATR